MLGIDKPTDGYIITGKYAEKLRYELRKAHDPNFIPNPQFEDFNDDAGEIIDLTGMSVKQIIETLKNHNFNIDENDVAELLKNHGFKSE